MSKRRRRWLVALGVSLLLVALTFALFPGQRLGLAFTIGTGIGTEGLQARIDELEERAIQRRPFSDGDREFLTDFYGTLATGAKLTVIVGQTGRLMDHYLAGSGADYRLDPEIFVENAKVQRQMAVLRERAAKAPCSPSAPLSSPTFYMPDPSKIDAVFGLYHGKLLLSRAPARDGRCVSSWRAEVPWQWPSYASLEQKYGSYHAESFPLPNLKVIFWGRSAALFVDNGLGEHLAQLGLAKPFVAFAEWEE